MEEEKGLGKALSSGDSIDRSKSKIVMIVLRRLGSC